MSRMPHRRLFRIVAVLMAALAVGATAAPGRAATATTTFQVTATVAATCLITATNLNFGTYSGVLADHTSALTVTCTDDTPYNVGLDAGTAPGATVTTRRMSGPGGAHLGYTLSQDAAHTINWGKTVGTDTESGTGNGSAQVLTVFGQVAAGEFVRPGAYVDTITATITF